MIESAYPAASSESDARPELVLSATLYLLSQCASDHLTPARASAVIQHLKMISGQMVLPVLLRETAERLIAHWQGVQTSLALEVGHGVATDIAREDERPLADARELRALLH